MSGMFDRLPGYRYNCIGFAFYKHGLINPEYACDFPDPVDLYQYFARVKNLNKADTIGIIGEWYSRICFVHLAVRHSPTEFIHRRNFYRPDPEIILARDIKADGKHSTSTVNFVPGQEPVDISFPEELVFLRKK